LGAGAFILDSPDAFNTIHVREIDGFKNSMVRSRQGGIEYLHIMKQGRKVGTLSEFHHQNYWEIKQGLSEKIQDLGFES
jgi:hypothetical protein